MINPVNNDDLEKPRRGNKYIPIAEKIRKGILEGKLNGRLPSVPELAKQNITTQATMHKALTLLRKEGFLHTITGSGTYVIPLQRPRTRTLGLIVPGTGGGLARQLIGSIQRSIQPYGLSMRAESLDEHEDSVIEAARALMQKPSVDGIIAWLVDPNPEMEKLLSSRHTPVVFISETKIPTQENSACVYLNNQGAASDVMMHLISNGYQKIGCLTDRPETFYSEEREEQFNRSLKAAGREPGPVLHIGQSGKEDFSPAQIRTLSQLDAVFCITDTAALRLMKLCLQKGWRVPQDLAITGFDNTRNTDVIGLTSVDSHLERAGQEAVRTILKYIEGRQTEALFIEVPPELIIRESSRKPHRS